MASNLVFIGGTKGGSTKTTTAHLLCLGAILFHQPVAYVLTDPKRQVRAAGRPYGVLDGRDPDELAKIISLYQTSGSGWLIIDGGGNRPAFDKEVAASVDLSLFPFRASQEDIDTLRDDLNSIPEAFGWPAAWHTNPKAETAAQKFIDELSADFPLRLIHPPIYFVNSISDLLSTDLASPSTPVRSIARRAFEVMEDKYRAVQKQLAATGQPAKHEERRSPAAA